MKKNVLPKIALALAFSIAGGLVAEGLSIALFGKKASNASAQIVATNIQYNDFQFDYIIRQPNETQIAEFKNSQYASQVVEYSYVSFEFMVGNEPIEQKILWTDNKIEITEFCNSRIASETKDVENSIYLDHITANKYGLKLKDKLSSGSFEFVITRIYQNYDGLLAYSPNLKTLYSNLGRSFPKTSGVYVVTSDKNNFYENHLKGYKPLNELKEKTSSQTDAEYQDYVDSFYAKDYSDRITDKTKGKEEALQQNKELNKSVSKFKVLSVIVSSVLVLATLALSLIIPFKKIKNEVDVYGNRKQVQKRYFLTNSCAFFFVLISYFLSCFIFRSTNYFVSMKLMLSTNILTLVLPLVITVVMFAVDYFVIRGFHEKNNK